MGLSSRGTKCVIDYSVQDGDLVLLLVPPDAVRALPVQNIPPALLFRTVGLDTGPATCFFDARRPPATARRFRRPILRCPTSRPLSVQGPSQMKRRILASRRSVQARPTASLGVRAARDELNQVSAVRFSACRSRGKYMF